MTRTLSRGAVLPDRRPGSGMNIDKARVTPLEVSYGHLLDYLRCLKGKHEIVETFLKTHAEIFVDNERAVERIRLKGVEKLVFELEKMALLTDVCLLNDLLNLLEDEKLTMLFEDFLRLQETGSDTIPVPPEVDAVVSLRTRHPHPDINPVPPEVAAEVSPLTQHPHPISRFPAEVKEVIIENIGSNWDRLAHNLDLKQSRIDYIDENYPSNRVKAREVLNCFEERSRRLSANQLLCRLQKALTDSKRTDVVNQVRDILFDNESY